MADDAQSIRNLNWREMFPFLNLFRAFRVAIHPSKLVLAFALLVLVYVGGRFLDACWPAHYYAVADELDQYTGYQWAHDQSKSFSDEMETQREQNAMVYRAHLVELSDHMHIDLDTKSLNPDLALEAARRGRFHSDMQAGIVNARNQNIAAAQTRLNDDNKAIDDNKDLKPEERVERKRAAKNTYDTAYRGAQEETLAHVDQLDSITPRPLFDTFFEYESRQFHNVVSSALNGYWFTGLTEGNQGMPPQLVGRHPLAVGAVNVGVLRCIANMTVIGPGWLLHYHWFYFLLFAVWFLLVWAIFGGAIARIAAVHISRDEKLSVREALRFSTSKLLSFVFAPVIPLAIIAIVGLVIAIGGLLFYLPAVGPIIAGALFILPLLAGCFITLVATGTVAGFNLMYPTIAVEGSDSFDAISRSFSYIFARPWRMIFYTVVSLIYGALCFFFVRFFVYVMLTMTHFFVGAFLGGRPGRYWPEIWPPVSDQDMAYRINFPALAWSEAISAALIAAWVYIVLTLLAAFVISFYFSSNSIIYFLMRREVDATELDDVYIEESEEEFVEPATTTAPASTPTAAVDVDPVPPAAPQL